MAEDDLPLAGYLQERLHQEQFTVQIATRRAETGKLAMDQSFDLILLDLNLQGATGLEALRRIRARKPDLPVMLLTGTGVLEERIRGLDAGADDYLSKPFAFAELSARIRAVLRRGGRPGEAVLQVADLKLDRLAHTVQRAGRTSRYGTEFRHNDQCR